MTKDTDTHEGESQSYFNYLTTLLGYTMLIVFGHIRDAFARLTGRSRFVNDLAIEKEYAPLVYSWETFYVRRLFNRIQDCWNRPVSSRPGGVIDVVERKRAANGKSLEMIDSVKTCVNLGSYNYLGFADDWDNTCGEQVRASLKEFSVGTCSAPCDMGYTVLHQKLERVVAEFIGTEDSLVFNMGYGTNSNAIPALAGPGTLVVSDTLNHTSIVNGCRASGAKTRTFKHNDPADLERVLRAAIAVGQDDQPLHKPWKKIIVMVEGIYSMEGEICELRKIVNVSKAHRCYIYVDEAHSIGALGRTGRGVCEHTGVDPSEIDILMGTFTKSFGGMGGYIAGNKELIRYLRGTCGGALLCNGLSPVVCAQVLRAFEIIDGKDGTTIGKEKLDSIKSNSNFFRKGLRRMGCGVLGDEDSPVIPLMLYHPTKIAAFSRECYARGLAVVVVGFPAVPLYGARARFCISAAHTKEDMVDALKKIREVCKILNLRYERSMFG